MLNEYIHVTNYEPPTPLSSPLSTSLDDYFEHVEVFVVFILINDIYVSTGSPGLLALIGFALPLHWKKRRKRRNENTEQQNESYSLSPLLCFRPSPETLKRLAGEFPVVLIVSDKQEEAWSIECVSVSATGPNPVGPKLLACFCSNI